MMAELEQGRLVISQKNSTKQSRQDNGHSDPVSPVHLQAFNDETRLYLGDEIGDEASDPVDEHSVEDVLIGRTVPSAPL
jgi:hypothetical protein